MVFKFNKEQAEIIKALKGSYLINAPVGTGKTTVLTERVSKAIATGFKAEEILCLTFTNRAAEEMIERVKKRINNREIYDQLTIKTFHGFCAYFVKAEAKEIGLNNDFVIFDEDDQIDLLDKAVAEVSDYFINEENKKKELQKLAEKIYRYRQNKIFQEIGCLIPETKISAEEEKIGEKYLKLLSSQNALDFNELVIITLKTLYQNEKIRKKWSDKYKFIQLDEFQDTHLSEYLIIKELAKKHKNLSFIGDLDQTIYSWRGSQPFLIIKLFKTHFSLVKEMSLSINYRCEQNLLLAIKSFLSSFDNKKNEQNRSSAKTEKDSQVIDVFRAYNFNEEISYLLKNIENIKKHDQGARIAVLSRANYIIKQIADIFKEKNVEHVTVDKYDFFRRQEIKDVIAYLKIIFNKYDLESAFRVLSRPHRGIGPASLKDIKQAGQDCALNLADFLDLKNYKMFEPFASLLKNWQSGRMVVLDTETTGTNTLRDEIVQIYAVEVINGQIGKDFHFFLKNSIPVASSEAVHGLSDEFLREKGKEAKVVLNDLKNFIKDSIVVGHNVNFDLNMIYENCRRNEIVIEIKDFYDTLDLSRRLVDSESYKLSYLAEKFSLSKATHNAEDDVLATVDLLQILIKKLIDGTKKRAELFGKYNKKFIHLANLIANWQKKSKLMRPADFAEFVWQDSGLADYYQKDKEADKRISSFKTLLTVFKDKDDLQKKSDLSLRELIQYSALVRDIDFLGLDKGKIPIVTVHQVKGLEFDYVFLPGLNDGKFPIGSADLEEEKRLFYVALTRARKKVFLSFSRFDNYGRPLVKSRFIDFIDKSYLNFIS